MKTSDQLKIGAALLGAVAIFLAIRKFKNSSVAGAAQSVVTGAAHVASQVVGGVVQGIGTIIGVPTTDEFKCLEALQENRGGAASVYCTVPVYADYFLNGKDSAIKKLGITPPAITAPAVTATPKKESEFDRVLLNLESAGGGII